MFIGLNQNLLTVFFFFIILAILAILTHQAKCEDKLAKCRWVNFYSNVFGFIVYSYSLYLEILHAV